MSRRRRPPLPGQRPAGFVPAATLQEAEARAMPQQPQALREWWLRSRLPQEPPGHADHVVNGMTGEDVKVADASAGWPRATARRRRRRVWCSLCGRYLTQKDVKAGHEHGPAAARAPARQKPRRQNWKTEGLAGRESMEEQKRGR